MNPRRLVRSSPLVPTLLLAAACAAPGATVQVGYVQMAVDGDVALSTGTGGVTASASQDIGSAFGLGDDQGSPSLRGQLDLGVPVLTISAFAFEESGQGTLNGNFGGIAASTAVRSDLEFANLKSSLVFDFEIGPVKLAPGLAVSLFDVQFAATEIGTGNQESIDEILPVPMLFGRAEVDAGFARVIGEVGFLDTPEINDFEGRFLDFEALLEVDVVGPLHLFGGYRWIDIDAQGQTDGDSFDLAMTIAGWQVGGGLRF